MSSSANVGPARLQRQLARLRQEFDSSFAEAIDETSEEAEQLLCFTAGGAGFAMSMAGLQGVAKCSSLTPMPARAQALLGVAVVRAQVVPVYSLTRLAGGGTRRDDCHWLALLRGEAPVAIAVESLDGYAEESAVEFADGDSADRLIRGLVRHNGTVYATVRGAEIYERITATAAWNERG